MDYIYYAYKVILSVGYGKYKIKIIILVDDGSSSTLTNVLIYWIIIFQRTPDLN